MRNGSGPDSIEQDRMRRVGEFMQRSLATSAIQSTRPGLIGAMLADSPVAQFAWIHDKFQEWTHPQKCLPGRSSVNSSCSTMRRFTGSRRRAGRRRTSAMRRMPVGAQHHPAQVPTAVIVFAHDVGLRFAEESGTTSSAGRMSKSAADTSPHSRSRVCCWTTCGSSSGHCGDTTALTPSDAGASHCYSAGRSGRRGPARGRSRRRRG